MYDIVNNHIRVNGVVYNGFHYPSEACIIERYNSEKLIVVDDTGSDRCGNRTTASFTGLGKKSWFNTDEDIAIYVRTDLLNAIRHAVVQVDCRTYVLNIMAKDCHCYMDEDGKKWLNRHQIGIYEPIVRYFVKNGFGAIPMQDCCIATKTAKLTDNGICT